MPGSFSLPVFPRSSSFALGMFIRFGFAHAHLPLMGPQTLHAGWTHPSGSTSRPSMYVVRSFVHFRYCRISSAARDTVPPAARNICRDHVSSFGLPVLSLLL